MFSLLKKLSSTYTWPVVANVPADGGKTVAIKFEAEFLRVSASRAKELVGVGDPDADRPKNDADLLDEVLVELRAKNDEGKIETLPDDVRADLFAVVGVERAVAMAFFSSLNGEKAKN